MSYLARDIMSDAAATLLDVDAVRWTASELYGYLNDGLKAVAAAKPNAYAKTVTLTLAAGTLQTLPAEYRSISRVTRNLTLGHTDPGGPTGGAAIRSLASTAQLDALIPDWQSNASMQGQTVQHVIYDLADPERFYVAPANDGTGKIEAVVLANPPVMTISLTNNQAKFINNYNSTIPLGDEYKNALRDYVLARAYSKDAAIPGSAARAAAHAQLFNDQMAALSGGEAATSLEAKAKGAT